MAPGSLADLQMQYLVQLSFFLSSRATWLAYVSRSNLLCRFEFLGDTAPEAEVLGLVDRHSAQSILQGVLRDTLDTTLALVQGPGIIFAASLSQASFFTKKLFRSNKKELLKQQIRLSKPLRISLKRTTSFAYCWPTVCYWIPTDLQVIRSLLTRLQEQAVLAMGQANPTSGDI